MDKLKSKPRCLIKNGEKKEKIYEKVAFSPKNEVYVFGELITNGH
jgi:hypothetical protein